MEGLAEIAGCLFALMLALIEVKMYKSKFNLGTVNTCIFVIVLTLFTIAAATLDASKAYRVMLLVMETAGVLILITLAPVKPTPDSNSFQGINELWCAIAFLLSIPIFLCLIL